MPKPVDFFNARFAVNGDDCAMRIMDGMLGEEWIDARNPSTRYSDFELASNGWNIIPHDVQNIPPETVQRVIDGFVDVGWCAESERDEDDVQDVAMSVIRAFIRPHNAAWERLRDHLVETCHAQGLPLVDRDILALAHTLYSRGVTVEP